MWKFRMSKCVILCKGRSRSNKKDRLESSSSYFVLVKLCFWMHKSMCVFFSSLNTCWSLYGSMSYFRQRLFYCQHFTEASQHFLPAYTITTKHKLKVQNHNTHSAPSKPATTKHTTTVAQHGLTLYTSCQNSKIFVRYVYRATGEKHT